MNYTKGDWTIQELPHKHDFRKGCSYVIRDKRNCALAEVGHIDAIFDGEETLVNAHLIAAAPDMYEALKMCQNFITRTRSMGRTYSDEEVFQAQVKIAQKMNEALAKAEGVK